MLDLNEIKIKRKLVSTKSLWLYMDHMILRVANAKSHTEVDMGVGSVLAVLAVVHGEEAIKKEDALKLKDALCALGFAKHKELENADQQ